MFAREPEQIEIYLPLDYIIRLTQQRKEYHNIRELADGIAETGFWSRLVVGQISPLQFPHYLAGINDVFRYRPTHVVAKLSDRLYGDFYWPLICGHRRIMALALLLKDGAAIWRKKYPDKSPEWILCNVTLKNWGGNIPCIGLVGVSPYDAIDRQIMENTYDPPPTTDAAQSTRDLWMAKTAKAGGKPPSILRFAAQTGLSESTVRSHLGVFDCAAKVQEAFFKGIISLTAVNILRGMERLYGYHCARKNPATAPLVDEWEKKRDWPILKEPERAEVVKEVVDLMSDYLRQATPSPHKLKIAVEIRLGKLTDTQASMWDVTEDGGGGFFLDNAEEIEATLNSKRLLAAQALTYGLSCLAGVLQRICFLDRSGLLMSKEHPWYAKQARERYTQVLDLLERTTRTLKSVVDSAEYDRGQALINSSRAELARAERCFGDEQYGPARSIAAS